LIQPLKGTKAHEGNLELRDSAASLILVTPCRYLKKR
jgi:hypothetical protein